MLDKIPRVRPDHLVRFALQMHPTSGPSAARTLASGAVVSLSDFSDSFGFIRGAREHGEEGPLARAARQGVKEDSFAGEPSKNSLERLRRGLCVLTRKDSEDDLIDEK